MRQKTIKYTDGWYAYLAILALFLGAYIALLGKALGVHAYWSIPEFSIAFALAATHCIKIYRNRDNG